MPKKTWLKDMTENLKETEMKTWRRKAQDREVWAEIVH
jgi:hypothetical protein